MNSNKRIRLDIIIGKSATVGSQTQLIELADDICMAISAVSAGCSLNSSTGFWSREGDKFLDKYEHIDKQDNIHIHVTILPEKQDEVLAVLQDTLQNHSLTKILGITSVHVEITPVSTQHLSL